MSISSQVPVNKSWLQNRKSEKSQTSTIANSILFAQWMKSVSVKIIVLFALSSYPETLE